MQQPSLNIDMKLKTHLENDCMELNPEAGAVRVGAGLRKEREGECIKGRVREEGAGVVERVDGEVNCLVGEGAEGIATDDVVEEK